jgi:hypothetical protein
MLKAYQLAGLSLALAVAACVAQSDVAAPGPYDGKWIGRRDIGGNCATVVVELDVTNNRLSGVITSNMETNMIANVRVGVDGQLRFSTYNRPARWGAISFSQTGFAMGLDSVCGNIVISGHRV